MTKYKIQIIKWIMYLPIRFAFRIIWLMVIAGNDTAKNVYAAMWDANLDMPLLKGKR
jgi:hypothetical protein